jgi:hypothetical protein
VSNDDDDDDDDDGSKLWGKQQNSSLLVLFRGAGESAARDIFFHFVPRRFLNAKGEFERNLSQSFFSKCRLFRKTFPQSCHVCPFDCSREIFYSFSRGLFSSELFFFAFSSLRCELSIREIPYSYISACIYIFLL